MLVLLGSADPGVITHLDESLIAEAETVDIRSGVVWLEVSDCRAFLHRLVSQMSGNGNGSSPSGAADASGAVVKVAVAQVDSSPQELVQKALMAVTLTEVADLLEQEELASADLDYEVRYQPIVRLNNRSVVGFEALIRARVSGEILTANDLIARATKGGWLSDLDQLSRQLAVRASDHGSGGPTVPQHHGSGGMFDLAAARRTIRQAEDIGLEPDQVVFETAGAETVTPISTWLRRS